MRLLAESAGTAAEQNRKNTLCALENSLRFVCAAFGDEQELWILLHGLQDCGAAAFLQRKQLRLSGAAVPRNAGSKGRGAAGGIEQGAGL
ncbi:MAG: hypothetical protein ACLS3C_04920 [Oscillospiraceae bacterium]